jgi:hypothetical protein
MANQLRQPSPPNGLHPHHGPPPAHAQMNGHLPIQGHPRPTPQHLAQLNEAVWLQIGTSATRRPARRDAAANPT